MRIVANLRHCVFVIDLSLKKKIVYLKHTDITCSIIKFNIINQIIISFKLNVQQTLSLSYLSYQSY